MAQTYQRVLLTIEEHFHILVYVSPASSSYNKCNEDNFEILERDVVDFTKNGSEVVIFGDALEPRMIFALMIL